jgi:uncharacterized protein (DUF2147 family)
MRVRLAFFAIFGEVLMKRFCFALVLMALSSSAHAGDSFSFVVAGHRIRIEASRHCRSASCVFVSIPGLYRSNRWRDRDDDGAAAPVPVTPPAAAPAAAAVTRVIQPSIASPASPPPVQPAASVPPPVPAPQPASTTAKIIVLPAPPPAAPDVSTTQTITPPLPPEIAPMTPAEAPPVVAPKPIPVPSSAPPISKVSQQTEQEPADTPLGDWQTEGNKGTVRVERCGQAICGYLVNPTSDAKGDTILINMKPTSKTVKSDTVWSGNVYSRSSGATYYSTMTMKGTDTLRVEACALGRFFCSGNDWTRLEKPSKLMTYREISPRPPS